MKGILIALKKTKDIKVMDARTDKEETSIALKLIINEEKLTVVAL